MTHCKHPTVPSEKMTAGCNWMAQILSVPYHRVYDSRYLQADCQEPGSAPESSLGSRVWATFFRLIPKVGGDASHRSHTAPTPQLFPSNAAHRQFGGLLTTYPSPQAEADRSALHTPLVRATPISGASGWSGRGHVTSCCRALIGRQLRHSERRHVDDVTRSDRRN